MLNYPTQTQIIRVEEKRFRVVPVVFDKDAAQQFAKSNKPNLHQPKGLTEDNLGGWVNAEDEDEPSCKVDFKALKGKAQTAASKPEKAEAQDKEYTHFFAIPLNFKAFQDQVKKLHDGLAKTFESKYTDYLYSVDKVHATLLMLKLDTDEKKKKIAGLKDRIQKEVNNIVNNQKIVLSPSSLDTFQEGGKGEEKFTKIVFASVRDNQGLKIIKEITHVITSILVEENVLSKEDLGHTRYNELTKKYEIDRPHITLLRNDEKKLKNNEIESLMNKFKKFQWNDVQVDHIDILTRFEFGADGNYKTLERFSL